MALRDAISAVLLLVGALAITSLVANFLTSRATGSAHAESYQSYQPPSIEKVQRFR